MDSWLLDLEASLDPGVEPHREPGKELGADRGESRKLLAENSLKLPLLDCLVPVLLPGLCTCTSELSALSLPFSVLGSDFPRQFSISSILVILSIGPPSRFVMMVQF